MSLARRGVPQRLRPERQPDHPHARDRGRRAGHLVDENAVSVEVNLQAEAREAHTSWGGVECPSDLCYVSVLVEAGVVELQRSTSPEPGRHPSSNAATMPDDATGLPRRLTHAKGQLSILAVNLAVKATPEPTRTPRYHL